MLSQKAAIAENTAERLDVLNASLNGIPSNDASRITYISNLRVELKLKVDELVMTQSRLRASRNEVSELKNELLAYKGATVVPKRIRVSRVPAGQLK